jgi:short subunit dehydrogenase-like uncharacterized protein
MTKRRFDLVLYGATGFVGRRAAAYLAERGASSKLRWAIAGRDAAKLAALRDELAADAGAQVGSTRSRTARKTARNTARATTASVPDVLVADSRDTAAVAAMAGATRVLISTAGPFALYGDAVVDGCVEQRTHYADITGETVWVKRLIDRHHARAERDGTRIVPFCGFDSVPSDVGTLLLVRHVEQAFGVPCVEVKAFFRMSGSFNGGTLATNAHAYQSGEVDEARNPFLLNPRGRHSVAQLRRSRDPGSARYDPTVGTWVAPFVMGPINSRVVRRSAALSDAWGEAYGPRFVYQEYMKVPPPLAAAKATAVAVAMAGFGAAMKSNAARRLIGLVSPKPGEGPSEASMARGWFVTELFGFTADGRSAGARIAFRGDPGNRATVRMLCESGLALAFDTPELPGGAARGGVLTPATALGEVLVPRLREAGFEIRVGA